MHDQSKYMDNTGHISRQSDSMAFDEDDDNSANIILRKETNPDLTNITSPIRQLNTSIHDYNEVSYCFGMFKRIKKTRK